MEFLNAILEHKYFIAIVTIAFVVIVIGIVIMWFMQPVKENLVIQSPDGSQVDIKADVTFKYDRNASPRDFINNMTKTSKQCQDKINEKAIQIALANDNLTKWASTDVAGLKTIGEVIDSANDNGLGVLINSLKGLGLNVKLEEITKPEPKDGLEEVVRSAVSTVNLVNRRSTANQEQSSEQVEETVAVN